LSNQKFNEYVKEVCKLAGINDPIEVQKTRGGVRKKEIKEKWELTTSHTARRTFASNLYLEGVPIKFIMKFTGHKTIQSFMSYIHVTDEEGYEMVERIMGKKYDVRMAS
jgi:integrase